jgi:hypothetical protein
MPSWATDTIGILVTLALGFVLGGWVVIVGTLHELRKGKISFGVRGTFIVQERRDAES